jgi:cupin 2 domain-containing protein
MPALRNIFEDIPDASATEQSRPVFESAGVKIERIVSHSHASPKDFWYDQDHDEWVLVLRGDAVLEFGEGRMVEMRTGDHLLIPKHVKHRVERTCAEAVWLAVHMKH